MLMPKDFPGAQFKKEEGEGVVGLNIFYSGIEYTEKDWVRLRAVGGERRGLFCIA